MQPLHLKYRPQNLEQLVGQEPIKKALSNAIARNRIVQAYLFAGPKGTGKTSTARILAKSLNCTEAKEPTIAPCGKCSSCRTIELGSSLDVSEIDAASHNGVDYARELVERSHLAPAVGRYRIFIIDECHMLSNSAQNALLKCIEEPPARTIFILATTELHKVLPTIASRCQVFNFQRISQTAIARYLKTITDPEKISIDPEAIALIAKTAKGSLRDSLQLLSQLALLDETISCDRLLEIAGQCTGSELSELLLVLASGNPFAILQQSRSLLESGKTPELILDNIICAFRDLLVVKQFIKAEGRWQKAEGNLEAFAHTSSVIGHQNLLEIAQQWQLKDIQQAFDQLQTSGQQLRHNPNADTWLEVCLLNLRQEAGGRRQKTESKAVPQRCHGIQVDSTKEQSNADASQIEGSSEDSGTKINASTVPEQSKPFAICHLASALTETWNQIINSTSAKNQKFLSVAQLDSLDSENQKAVLRVPASDGDKFNKHKEAIARRMEKVLGYLPSLTIETEQLPSGEKGAGSGETGVGRPKSGFKLSPLHPTPQHPCSLNRGGGMR